MLRGRCACNAVAYEVSDQFVAALNCHCSNCRAATGSAFLPWGEIAREKLRVTKGEGSLMVIGDADANHAMRCGECGSLLYWTVGDGTYVRVAYGSLIDEPELKPTAHIFVGSKAPWHEILDDLPRCSFRRLPRSVVEFEEVTHLGKPATDEADRPQLSLFGSGPTESKLSWGGTLHLRS